MTLYVVKCPICLTENRFEMPGTVPICWHCRHLFTKEEIVPFSSITTDDFLKAATAELQIPHQPSEAVKKLIEESEKPTKHCVPVLTAEGWLLFCGYTICVTIPVTIGKAISWVLRKLWGLTRFINWCIVMSIFRMAILIGVPIVAFRILTTINIADMWGTLNLILLLGGLTVLWVIPIIWIIESNSPDLKLVRKIALRKKE